MGSDQHGGTDVTYTPGAGLPDFGLNLPLPGGGGVTHEQGWQWLNQPANITPWFAFNHAHFGN